MFNFRLYFGIIKSISMSGKYIFICMKNFKFIQLFKAVRGGIYMAKTFKSGVTLLILTFFCSIFIFGNSAILKNVNAAAKINQSSSSTQIASVGNRDTHAETQRIKHLSQCRADGGKRERRKIRLEDK